ncbi:AAA family ATPase [Pectobacterium brasiliense]|uniref:AAA family ATPase n=1 Tax=Pectobacterium brasiliense TaxID=180957 RepID=UPI0019699EA6|nr:AAA family ATPase [Pectobacterium brasiliense]MBN3054486.1 AAA family ATPase [Pectobacterium brasiliense]
MRVTNIRADNYRGIKRMDIDLDRNFTILCGGNGVGKSSILFAISNALCINYNNQRIDSDAQIKLDFIGRDNEKYSVGFGRNTYQLNSNVSSRIHVYSQYINDFGVFENIYLDSVHSLFSPLFIGPYRNIPYQKISGMLAENSIVESRKKYIDNSFSSLSMGTLPNVKQWMINRYFITEKEWAKTEKYNWDFILSSLSNSFFLEGGFSFDKIERDLEPSFILSGKKVYLEELSSGFKSIVAILFSIVEWVETTNEGECAKVDNAKGTVLIDEIDSHLHPSWQTKIKNTLEKTFPNIQFIVTTHSPHVLSSANENEVLIIENNNGILHTKPVSASLEYWKVDSIFQDIMSFDTNYDKNLNAIIEQIEDLIDSKRYDEAKLVVEKYQSHAHPEDNTPRALIRRINLLMLKESI